MSAHAPANRLARRQMLPFLVIWTIGAAFTAAAPDNAGALHRWTFLLGASLAVIGIPFMALRLAKLPSRLEVALPVAGMLSTVLIAAATGGVRSDAIVLLFLPLMWYGYAAVGGQVHVGVAAFAALLVGVSSVDLLSNDPLRNWDHAATVLIVGVGLTYGLARVSGDRRELAARLEDLARTDPLTGLLNRRGFADVAVGALARAQRDGVGVGMLMLDLDGFKSLNDSLGHEAGDELLVEVARTWRSVLRAGDLLSRAGGDEFLVLLVETDDARAGDVAERLRASTPSAVSCSVGIAISAADDADFERLVSAADDALYAAKATGRDRAVFASGSTVVAAASRRAAAVSVPGPEDAVGADDLVAFERLLGEAGVMRFTALGDRFVSIAPEAERVLGWHPEQLLALTFTELIHPDDRSKALAEAARVASPGAAVDGFETRFRCRSGRYRRLRIHAHSDGTLWRAIAVDLGDAIGALPEHAAA